jgi:hypothetical protein
MMDSVEYSGNVPATGRADTGEISRAPPPAAADHGVRAIAKGGRHYRTPNRGSGSSHRSDTDGESSLAIGNNFSSLSSLPRLPAGGAVLDGRSISSASNSSLSEVFVEVPGHGTVHTTTHGPGTDSFFEDNSYKDSVEAMWGERPPACMHEGLGQCGHMTNSPPVKASWGGGAGGTAGPGGQAPSAAESHRPRLGQVPSAMREENQEVLGVCGSTAKLSSREVGHGFGGGDTDSLGGREPLPSRRPAFPCWDKSHRW